jgi:hypothetical protein
LLVIDKEAQEEEEERKRTDVGNLARRRMSTNCNCQQVNMQMQVGPHQDLANQVDPKQIRVVAVPSAKKRLQMSHGIKNALRG